MRVTIIGGHGKVALLAEPKLVAAGHEVRAVIRKPEQTKDVEATGATVVVADVESLDERDLADLLRGSDVVVWSAGAGGGNPDRTAAVDKDAAIRSMDAAHDAGVGRYVMVSYLGSGTPNSPHGVPEDDPFFAYAEAKTAADAHLRQAEMTWTILKPSRLTEGPSNATLDPSPAGRGDTARALVADVIVAVVEAPEQQVAGLELEFVDGDVPVSEALGG